VCERLKIYFKDIHAHAHAHATHTQVERLEKDLKLAKASEKAKDKEQILKMQLCSKAAMTRDYHNDLWEFSTGGRRSVEENEQFWENGDGVKGLAGGAAGKKSQHPAPYSNLLYTVLIGHVLWCWCFDKLCRLLLTSVLARMALLVWHEQQKEDSMRGVNDMFSAGGIGGWN
jgi:hypothetical protein